MEQWFTHSGDMGDVLFALPTIKAKGGGTLYLFDTPGKTAHGMTQAKADSLRSLLIQQPYIKDVIFCPQGHEDQALNGFRHHFRPYRNLADMHLATHALGPEHRAKAWLQVEPKQVAPVVIHRSPRYQNNYMPWRRIVEQYKGKAVMIGSPAEWERFVSQFGHVPYYRTANMLELAQVIAGAKLYCGNQSSPEAVAEGLKQNKILEVAPNAPASCMYKRIGAVYCLDEWHVELPEL